MEEATEICKLRLFLKLVSQVDKFDDIEPLPDIDFNIRAGNTLVGFASYEETKKAIEGKTTGKGNTRDEVAFQSQMIFDDRLERIEQKAQEIERAFDNFRKLQTQLQLEAIDMAENKQHLRQKLDVLRTELDSYQASEYGIDRNNITKTEDYDEKFVQWQRSHQPFHWWIEFYGIMKRGGFDVIIGNPPYAELRSVTLYSIRGLTTVVTKNLYPLVIERCIALSSHYGRLGFIVPVSSVSTEGYQTLQDIVFAHPVHASSFDDRPARLFDGLEHIQLTIHLIQNRPATQGSYFSTECLRWSAAERDTLFSRLQYQMVGTDYLRNTLPKISRSEELSILEKLWKDKKSIVEQESATGSWKVYYSRKVHNFLQALDFVPEVYDGSGNLRPPSELKELRFPDARRAALIFCVLNSTLFRWFVNVFSDCRHVNKREIEGFRIDLERVLLVHGEQCTNLASQLSASLRVTSEYRSMRFKHDVLRVQCIIPKHSKPIIDEIDRVLAKHYGFTDEELDFIINYDIKYRMGQDNLDESEE
jgi:Eco57I restriction-modification methylase